MWRKHPWGNVRYFIYQGKNQTYNPLNPSHFLGCLDIFILAPLQLLYKLLSVSEISIIIQTTISLGNWQHYSNYYRFRRPTPVSKRPKNLYKWIFVSTISFNFVVTNSNEWTVLDSMTVYEVCLTDEKVLSWLVWSISVSSSFCPKGTKVMNIKGLWKGMTTGWLTKKKTNKLRLLSTWIYLKNVLQTNVYCSSHSSCQNMQAISYSNFWPPSLQCKYFNTWVFAC